MRLIDADRLPHKDLSDGKRMCMVVFSSDIASAPTIDAVEVVRCKDCVNHYDCTGVKLNCCLKTGIYVDDDEFCSKAERRTDG